MTTWHGCMLAARFADFWHGAHDFGSLTLCSLPLTGLSEGHVTAAMRECPACAQAVDDHAGHSADGCPLTLDPDLRAGYDAARRHGDSYAAYIIQHDLELRAKGRPITAWPTSLRGNDGD